MNHLVYVIIRLYESKYINNPRAKLIKDSKNVPFRIMESFFKCIAHIRELSSSKRGHWNEVFRMRKTYYKLTQVDSSGVS